jgi:hypothetical protein
MLDTLKTECPECEAIDRRDFVRYISIGAGALATTGTTLLTPRSSRADTDETGPKPRLVKNPAEDLVKELYSAMTAEQKTAVCRPFDDNARLSVAPNRALDKTIGTVFSKTQQELIERIVKAISSGPEGWNQITRAGTWDASKTFGNTGANIFGDPLKGKFAFLFTGHHLTVRCDGDSTDSTAFGGPIYYGHTPNGYSDKNVFYYQTQEAMKAFDALDEKQREKALVKKGNPGEGPNSVKLKGEKTAKPGIAYSELTSDQRELLTRVMRTLLSPFRAEDADEVMKIIKDTGGMEKIHLAFYSDAYENEKTTERQPWSFWRLEGPGFVWNFRVLPHVHTYVNISAKA